MLSTVTFHTAAAELREFGSQLEKEYLSEPKYSPLPDQPGTQLTPLPPAEPRPLQG